MPGRSRFPAGGSRRATRIATEAALRETEEEVGLPRDHVTVIGRLDTYVTGTGFEITPIVGIVKAPFPLALDPFEVAEVFEVPLSFVLDPNNHRRMTRDFEQRTRTFLCAAVRGPLHLGRDRRHAGQSGRGARRLRKAMLRVLLTIVLPLVLPTALYLLWVTHSAPTAGGTACAWTALPWIWLAGAGVALLAFVLFVVTVHFGTPQEGVYVPPRWQNGHIVPGHIEPKPGR